MKKILLLSIVAISAVLAGCNKGKIAEMENEIADLRNKKHIADSLQGQFYEFLTDVENNLSEIKTKENIISNVASEKPQNMQERILQDLSDVANLMEKNRKRLGELESLRRKIKEANGNAEKLQELIDALERRVEEQEAQILALQEELQIANEKIVALTDENKQIAEENERKQALIDEQVVALNTGFYTTGTSAELKENGIITQKGGFIGIGKTQTINQNADLSKFTKVDIREFKRLETNSAKIDLITPHAAESFTLNSDDPKNIVIEISNPALFWKSSKYLVVRVREGVDNQ